MPTYEILACVWYTLRVQGDDQRALRLEVMEFTLPQPLSDALEAVGQMIAVSAEA